jgi:small subunit ribosomal protein S9
MSASQTSSPYTLGLGRRKSSVARVRLKSGAGGFLVNGREMKEFFPTLAMQVRAAAPLVATSTLGQYDVTVSVEGGGPVGQADAVLLGIARALKKLNPSFDAVLREQSLLTRDSRMKERKKYGRRGARRGFQFSKR